MTITLSITTVPAVLISCCDFILRFSYVDLSRVSVFWSGSSLQLITNNSAQWFQLRRFVLFSFATVPSLESLTSTVSRVASVRGSNSKHRGHSCDARFGCELRDI